MSYARFSRDSDVYVFLSSTQELECCGCVFGGRRVFETTDGMVVHLRKHQAAGHAVPIEAFAGLERDRELNERFIATGVHDARS